MSKCKTYLDTNVLIAAFRGKEAIFEKVMAILDDPNREFMASDFLRLETLPKPTFHKYEDELAFMEAFFESAQVNIQSSPAITGKAILIAGIYDIHPMDALHLSAALNANADEFVTLEKPDKPMFKVNDLHVTSLHIAEI